MYYVYVLKSLKTVYYYKWLTNDVDRRIKEHLSGFSKTTKKYLPLELVFVQVCKNRNEARILEKFLKSGCGREFLKDFYFLAM